MKRKHLPVVLVPVGVAAAATGVWLLHGPAAVLVLVGAVVAALGLLMEV